VSEDIRLEKNYRAGLITLSRRDALNALSLDMIRKREAALRSWIADPDIYAVVQESALDDIFCVGGDLRAIYDWKQQSAPELITVFREEYRHNWHLDKFNKPTVSLVNGTAMGSGVGMTIYGTHFVAGEKIRFAMPETAIGLFPDVGASYFLPRLPGKTGLYMGLTGYVADAADVYFLGIASHCVPSRYFGDIRAALIEAEPVDLLLEPLHRDPGSSPLAKHLDVINRVFSAPSVEDVLDALDRETGTFAEWARETARTLRQKAPMSLKVTFRLLGGGDGNSQRPLRDALGTEFRLACRFLESHDLFEGIRALIIDKDKTPKWRPDRLADITDEMVDRYFEPLGDGELELADEYDLSRAAAQARSMRRDGESPSS